MEDQLRGVPGVEDVRSSSVVGLSQVVLLFKMGTDVMEARQRVSEWLKLAIAELPQSSGMPIMLAAAVRDESRDEDRPHVEGLRHDGPVDDW